MTTSSIGYRECPVWFIDRAVACAFIVILALAIAPDLRADPIRFEMQVVDGPGKGFNDPVLGSSVGKRSNSPRHDGAASSEAHSQRKRSSCR